MASIVLGMGTSHTPQINTPPDIWHDHVERDRRNPGLLGRDGEYHSFDELAANPEWAVDESLLTMPRWQDVYQRSQRGVEVLAEALKRADPDVVVVIGDDQQEMFKNDGTPTFAVFWGEEIFDLPPSAEALAAMPYGIRESRWAVHGDEPEAYPVPSDLGRHLVEQFMVEEFDVAALTEQPAGRTLGHAFTFVRRRLMQGAVKPMVPVAINTYYPPNQPTPGRCYEFGRALRRGIESYPGTERVAVVGSGGLSHFVVDEQLDRRVLDGLAAHDVESIGSIPRTHLRSGTSEILNWIATGGATEHLSMEVVEYLPGYRSTAGTGVGIAFALWQ